MRTRFLLAVSMFLLCSVAQSQLIPGVMVGGGGGAGSGDVTGPASSIDGHLAVFSGTSGNVIEDGGVSGPTTEEMLVEIGYAVRVGDVVIDGGTTPEGVRVTFPADARAYGGTKIAGVALTASAVSATRDPVSVGVRGEVPFDTTAYDLWSDLCLSLDPIIVLNPFTAVPPGAVEPCGSSNASQIKVASVTVIGNATNGRISVYDQLPTLQDRRVISNAARTPLPGPAYNFSMGGCAAGLGCNTGQFFLLDDNVWDNSPGVLHSVNGSFFAAFNSAAVAQTDSPRHAGGAMPASQEITLPAITWTSGACQTGTGNPVNRQFCTSLELGTSDVLDKFLCRNSGTPWAECDDSSASCGLAGIGVDAPETLIVRHASTSSFLQDAGAYHHTPMFVTGYTGCTNGSSTNTLTVLPFQVKTGDINMLDRIQAGDTVQAAFNDNIHPASYYGHLLAENILTQSVDEAFHPRTNLVATGAMDVQGDCDAITTTATKTLIAHDPTKAAYLGTWSAVSGSACKFTEGTLGGVTTLPAFPVTPGLFYTCNVKAGMADATVTPIVSVLDQSAGTNPFWLDGVFRGARGLLIPITDSVITSASTSTLPKGMLAGWNTLVVKFQAKESQTTAAVKIDFASTTGNYVDDLQCFPSPNQGPVYAKLIPPGNHKILVATDSRGDTSSTDLTVALITAAAYLRPDITLKVDANVFSGRDLNTALTCPDDGQAACWNWPGRAKELSDKGYDYVVMFHGVNDFFSGAGTLTTPIGVEMRMLEAEAALRVVGIKTIWIKEPPIAGNSTFSTTAARCRDADGTTRLSCGRYVERLMRFVQKIAD